MKRKPFYRKKTAYTVSVVAVVLAIFCLGAAFVVAALWRGNPETPADPARAAMKEMESDLPVAAEVTEPVDPPDTITLSFLGDCMLASNHGEVAPDRFNYMVTDTEPAFYFAGVYDILSTDDFTVANCENVLTDANLQRVGKPTNPAYWYKGASSNAKIFTEGSIEIVSLANNHTTDYGAQGATDTIAAVEMAGLEWGNDSKPLVLEKYGIRIGLYLCTLYAEWNGDAVCEWIESVQDETDFQIVYYHGGKEREYEPDAWRIRAAKRMIDAGADVVIGGHPHVLQPIEEYHGGVIIHSLGNFLFGGSTRSEDNRTLIFQVRLKFDENGVTGYEYEPIPCYEYDPALRRNNWQALPMAEDDPEREKVLAYLHGERETPN